MVQDSPQQNGVAERMNRTLVESARTMISHAGLPNMYWAEAISTAAYVRNRMTTKAIKENKTPYERWYGKKPNLSHLRVFGCMAYVHIPDDERRKLNKKVEKMRFVGYSLTSKGYRLFDETKRKIFIRKDVEFNEDDFGHKETMTTTDSVPERKQEVEDVEGEIEEAKEEQSTQEPRRSGRSRKPPIR